jgi:hypothetical protein
VLSTSAHKPRLVTFIGLSLASIAVILVIVVWVATGDRLAGVYGWNTGPDGVTVTSVVPGLPADRAGIRAGDRVDFASLSLLGRMNTDGPQAVAAGEPLTVRFSRAGQTHSITMNAQGDIDFRYRNIVAITSGILVAIVGAFLLVLRPSPMTLGFLLVGVGAMSEGIIFRTGSPIALWTTTFVRYAGIAASWIGLLMFVSRFPTDAPKGWLRWLDRAAVPAGAIYFAVGAYQLLTILHSPDPPAFAAQFALQFILPALVLVTALSALVGAAVSARGSTRQRLIPVIATFALWTALWAGSLITASLFTVSFWLAYVPIVGGLSLILFAIATAYGVVRHRVIDVNFIVSRTVVYTLLTAILVGVFTLIDILISRWLESSQLAIVLELGVAVGVGFGLRSMHRRVDLFVDSVLFRRRHVAEQRLGRVSKALPHAKSAPFVDEALVVEPCESLDLASAALFRVDGDGRYKRRLATGWEDGSATSLDPSDHLIVQLEAELEPLPLADVRWPRNDIPSGLYQPLLAVPIVVRHRLVAFALYGGHNGGEALDPDEVRCLDRLAEPAGAAYDHLEAERLREELDSLKTAQEAWQRDAVTLDVMRRQLSAMESLLQLRGASVGKDG